MDVSELFEKIQSGLIKISFMKKDKCIGSGTGFLAEKYIITNHHVYLGNQNADRVVLRFIKPSALSKEYTEIKLTLEEFIKLLLSGSEENSYDFAILQLPDNILNASYHFEIEPIEPSRLGNQIAFAGFPFEIDRVTSHIGYISSSNSRWRFFPRGNIFRIRKQWC